MTRHAYLFALAALTIVSIKLILAVRLELYSDEIFYWQASQFPALAYSDLPFMSAWLAGSGAWLFGHHPLAVRSIFLLMGSCLPLLVYWLARPVTDQRQALESAALTLCLPMAAFLGLLAVPDVPLIFWGLLFIGCLERATRTGLTGWWLAAGLVAALGLSSHYRFALYIVAAFSYLVICRTHWHYWRSARLWAAVLLAATGLYPALSFNLVNDLSGLDYHLISRHPWQFQAEGLLHPFIQSVVVTPPLYIALWFTLWMLLKRARAGDHRAGLFAAFAAVNLGVYLVLAPWSDTTRTTVHWPLSGYLPLLIFLPTMLRSIQAWLAEKIPAQRARQLTTTIPALGLAGSLILLAGIGSQGFNEQLQRVLGTGVLSNKMAGWQAVTSHLEILLADPALPANPIVVTDNYYTSAQIKFALPQVQIFTTDQDKTVRDGRYTQYAIWGKDESGLRSQAGGRDAIFVTEDSTLNYDEKLLVMQRACGIFSELRLLDQIFLYNGDKTFSFYAGTDVRPSEKHQQAASPCPLPSLVWLDYPERRAVLSNESRIAGWVVNNGFGIDTIRILLNGRPVGQTSRTLARPDVVSLQNGEVDPDAPYLGFEYLLDTQSLRNGSYQLAIEVTARNGERQLAAERRITVRN